MSDHLIMARLTDLGLHGMAQGANAQQSQSVFTEMSFSERLSHCILAEEEFRKNRTRERLSKNARFRTMATPEGIEYADGRGLQRSFVTELCTCAWIRQGHNIVVTGAAGTGKTYLICALGSAATRLGLSVRYLRVNPLLEQMGYAHHDGSISRLRTQLAKVDLIILDDMAIAPIDDRSKEDLLELLDARVGDKSTVVAGQRPFPQWHTFLENPVLADAILDRMSQQAYKIDLRGESKRRPL
jgi:DNA replication protein DnaC